MVFGSNKTCRVTSIDLSLSLMHMTLQKEIILMLTGILVLDVAYNMLRTKRRGIGKGRPPINAFVFYLGKLCAVVCISFLFLGALGLKTNQCNLPWFAQWISCVLLVIGVLFSILSMHKLGDDLISGLPQDSINILQTNGIFRISRNPLYLGFFFVALSSIINVPNPINVVCCIIGILIHHKKVLAEERYLIDKVGNAYRDYMRQAWRYL